MNETVKKPGVADATDAAATRKQPYLKPAFRHEGVFETMALSCGKISGTQGACNSVKKLS
jgi:hypothetical protein